MHWLALFDTIDLEPVLDDDRESEGRERKPEPVALVKVGLRIQSTPTAEGRH